MEISTFLEDCLGKGIHLYLKDGELSYRAQKGAMTQDILLSINLKTAVAKGDKLSKML
jgi:hypothetical protein